MPTECPEFNECPECLCPIEPDQTHCAPCSSWLSKVEADIDERDLEESLPFVGGES